MLYFGKHIQSGEWVAVEAAFRDWVEPRTPIAEKEWQCIAESAGLKGVSVIGDESGRPVLADTEESERLKAKLAATDYCIVKIAEGAATREEYADIISQRQAWRARINELEENQH